jgi:hypothetical protein
VIHSALERFVFRKAWATQSDIKCKCFFKPCMGAFKGDIRQREFIIYWQYCSGVLMARAQRPAMPGWVVNVASAKGVIPFIGLSKAEQNQLRRWP